MDHCGFFEGGAWPSLQPPSRILYIMRHRMPSLVFLAPPGNSSFLKYPATHSSSGLLPSAKPHRQGTFEVASR
ncbi:hypothetical protein ACU8KH_04080 [Lachancea thermotolerans]